jgi:hypothetical protein
MIKHLTAFAAVLALATAAHAAGQPNQIVAIEGFGDGAGPGTCIVSGQRRGRPGRQR